MSATQIRKVNYWHERLADLMLGAPELTLGDIARRLGRTQTWISIVKNSDAFQTYWQARRLEANGTLLNNVREKAFGLTEMAQEALARKLESSSDVMSVTSLLNIVDVNMKRLGYSADKKASSPEVNINIGLVGSEALEEARARMRISPSNNKAIEPEQVTRELSLEAGKLYDIQKEQHEHSKVAFREKEASLLE